MNDCVNKFKAGDFTSGKMGEIFKSVFMDSRTTVINHKQFGDCYVIPKCEMKDAVNFVFNSFLKLEIQDVDNEMFAITDSEKPHLTQMIGNPYGEFAFSLIDNNLEGIKEDFDYFTIMTKLVDCLYLYDTSLSDD